MGLYETVFCGLSGILIPGLIRWYVRGVLFIVCLSRLFLSCLRLISAISMDLGEDYRSVNVYTRTVVCVAVMLRLRIGLARVI